MLTDNNFHERLQHESLLVVNFSAEWCGSCKSIAPIVDQIDRENSLPIKIAKVDVDESPLTSERYGIRSIPAFLFFKNGSLVDAVVGPIPKLVLKAKMSSLIEP